MGDIWFTSDLHLGHEKIIEYCNRPFTDVEHMDDQIISNINGVVGRGDRLYILGDFTVRMPLDAVAAYRDRIECATCFLIAGNHDPKGAHDVFGHKHRDLFRLKKLAPLPDIIMCHYAMRVWHHSYRGTWHLYGHSHGTLPDDPHALSMDVGVDPNNFLPVHIGSVEAHMSRKAPLHPESRTHASP